MLETKPLPGIGRKYTITTKDVVVRMLFLRFKMWRFEIKWLNNPQFKELKLPFCTITAIIYK